MKRFIVSYTLPYRHDVSVGITAASAHEAVKIAEAAYWDATLWNDTDEMPLVYDDYEEADEACSGGPLEFHAEEWDGEFVREACVLQLRREQAAMAACKALVTAYAKGADGGSISWSEIDDAYELALQAVPFQAHVDTPSQGGAWSLLDDFGDDEVIGDLYDEQPALRDALGVILPEFEYPDWADRAIGDVRRAGREGLTSAPIGKLAARYGFYLPLTVLESPAGFYLGTSDGMEPISRESVEYFPTKDTASAALVSGAWTQRDNP